MNETTHSIPRNLAIMAIFLLFPLVTIYSARAQTGIELDNWLVFGSAQLVNDFGTFLVVGDNIGSDPQDQDRDGNLWSSIYSSSFSPHDYDAIVSIHALRPPLTLYLDGLLSTTSKGYNEAGIAYKNPNYTGKLDGQLPIGTKLAYFTLHWEAPDVLQTGYFNRSEGSQTNYADVIIDGEPDTVDQDGDVYGFFEISWDGHTVTFKRDDVVVRTVSLEYEPGAEVVAYFRTYDNSFVFSEIDFEGEDAAEGQEPLSGSNLTTTSTPHESEGEGNEDDHVSQEGASGGGTGEEGGLWTVRRRLEGIYYGCSHVYFLQDGNYICAYGNPSGGNTGSLTLYDSNGQMLSELTQLAPIKNITMTGNGTLYAIGGAGERLLGTFMGLYRSYDGGLNWQDITDSIRTLTEQHSIELNYGQAFGGDSGGDTILIRADKILKSTDSGHTWGWAWDGYLNDSYPNCQNRPFAMKFADRHHGVIMVKKDDKKCSSNMNPDLYITEDGGATWRRLFSTAPIAQSLEGNLWGLYSRLTWDGHTGLLVLELREKAKDIIIEFHASGTYTILPNPVVNGAQVDTITDIMHDSHGLFAIADGKVFSWDGNTWNLVYNGGEDGNPRVQYFNNAFLNEFPPRLVSGYDVLVMDLASPPTVTSMDEEGANDTEAETGGGVETENGAAGTGQEETQQGPQAPQEDDHLEVELKTNGTDFNQGDTFDLRLCVSGVWSQDTGFAVYILVVSPTGIVAFMTQDPFLPTIQWDLASPIDPGLYAYRFMAPEPGSSFDQCSGVLSFDVPGTLKGTYKLYTIAGPEGTALNTFNMLSPLMNTVVTFH